MATIDLEPLLTEVLNFERYMYWVLALGIRTLTHHVLASTNFN